MNPPANPSPKSGLAAALALALALLLLAPARLAADPAEDLIAAAVRRDATAARAALKAGAPTKGVPPARAMNVASENGDFAMIDLLLSAGVPVDEVNSHGTDALDMASFKGNEKMVAHLLERGADATRIGHDPDGKPLLAIYGAIKSGSLAVAKMLLDHGADPNALDSRPTQRVNFTGDVEFYRVMKAAGGRDRQHPVMDVPGAREALEKFRTQTARDAAANAGLITLLAAKPAADAPRAAAGKCRLAIIADEPNAAAADLLTERLSAVPTLALVERTELDHMLAEQQLTRDLGTETEARLGSLLGADALLFVRARDAAAGRVVETRLVNVHPGLILASFFQPAPMADAKDWAEQMADRVPALAQRAAARDGFALSLLNVRAAVETASAREMEKTANLLIGQRLLREPGFYVLERSAFDQVAQEIALGKKAADSFWTGSYLVDGTLDTPLTAGDALVLTLRFRPGTGPAIEVQARGPREKLPAVLDEAVTRMHAALTHAPVAASPAEEEAHFIKEAHWQVRTGQYRQARQSMDTAWALGARDFETRHYRLLCHTWALQIPICEATMRLTILFPSMAGNDWSRRDYFNQPFRGDDFPSVDAAFEAAQEILRQYEEVGKEMAAVRDDEHFAEWLAMSRDALQAACFVPMILDTAAMKIQYADKLAQMRAVIDRMFRAAAAVQPPGPASVRAQGELMAEYARYLPIWPTSFERAREAHQEIMRLHFPGKDDLYLRATIRKMLFRAYGTFQAYYANPKNPRGEMAFTPFSNEQFLSQRAMTPAQRLTLTEDYKNSTAADDRLYAWAEISRLSHKDIKADKTAMQMIMSVVWELAPDLASDIRLFNLWNDSCEPLSSSPFSDAAKGEIQANESGHFSAELRNFRLKLLCYLLAQDAPIDTYKGLGESNNFSQAEAEKIRPALAGYFADKGPVVEGITYFTGRFGLPEPAIGSGLPAKPAALTIKKFWEPTELRLESGPDFDTNTRRMIWAEDRLWLVGDIYDQRQYLWQPETQSMPYVFSIEFPSMRATTIPLPSTANGRTLGHGALVVTPSRLIVIETGMALLIYDRQKTAWETVPEILPLGPPLILDNDLYVIIKGGLLRYDMVGKTTEVLFSNRRNPPQNPMDELANEVSAMHWNDNQELEILCVAADRKRTWCSYSPTTRGWRKNEQPVNWGQAERTRRQFPGYLGMMPIRRIDSSRGRGAFYLSFDETDNPATGIELKCAIDPEIESGRRWSLGVHQRELLVTKHGWIVPEDDSEKGRYVWFLPLADLKKYLRENPAALPMIEAYEKKNGTILLPKDPP